MSQADTQNEPKIIDGSAPLFSMYNERAKEHDEKMAESWKGDAEGILVFTGLFSAAVAQLLGSVLQSLQLNPQDASSFYLARIYQLTPGSNAQSIHLPDNPDGFKPPKTAIWVSILWSLSLVISLSCALLATLLQQWARRYLRITQKWNDPQKRAQIRELMRLALKKQVRLRWMVELLPTLLHISVFLFLVGFVAYLSTFNHSVAKWAGACAGTCALLYMYISLVPIISRDSPYYTPLTTLVWAISMGIASVFLRLRHFVASRSSHLGDTVRIQESFQLYYQRVVKGVAKDVEKLADTQSSDLATFVLLSTFDSLDGDGDMEQFLSRIPGLYASARVHLDGNAFARFNSDILPSSIMSFMDHVLSSNLPDSAKQNCVAICSRAINANLLLLQSTFRQILQTLNSDIFNRADFVRLALEHLRRDDQDSDPWVKDYAQCIVAVAMNRTHLEDGAWIDMAWHYLKPHHAQYRWEAHNLRLCNLIYITRQLKDSRLENSDQFEIGGDWYIALVEARKLEVRGTALGLRLEFRALWNELVGVAHDWQASETTRQNAHKVLYLLYTVYNFM
ncbi:hypothetical protein EDB92DRAFT_1947613 [Lactarius akahatsu]|uniref:DUF6535 domain-containing protein n=1 Tax=Lactarius akahatsu TaxID=416441 RepID=A0AAD4QCF0_9AGAM|nr:hypothetical protein EDB92DRAFT_1947613 [Lactarius akahatsu]